METGGAAWRCCLGLWGCGDHRLSRNRSGLFLCACCWCIVRVRILCAGSKSPAHRTKNYIVALFFRRFLRKPSTNQASPPKFSAPRSVEVVAYLTRFGSKTGSGVVFIRSNEMHSTRRPRWMPAGRVDKSRTLYGHLITCVGFDLLSSDGLNMTFDGYSKIRKPTAGRSWYFRRGLSKSDLASIWALWRDVRISAIAFYRFSTNSLGSFFGRCRFRIFIMDSSSRNFGVLCEAVTFIL